MALSGQQLIALIIDKNPGFADSLEATLQPELSLDEIEVMTTLEDGFQALLDRNFNICFISVEFKDALDSFFRDMSKIGRDKTCSFIQLWDVLPKLISQAEVKKLGFAGYVSKAFSPKEKMVLRRSLEGELNVVHVSQSLTKVHDAVEVLLRELDGIARRKKRGRTAELDTVISGYVKRLTSLDPSILDHYFEELCSSTNLSKAFSELPIVIPDKLAAKELPGLTKTGYKGQSERVFEMFQSKFATPPEKE